MKSTIVRAFPEPPLVKPFPKLMALRDTRNNNKKYVVLFHSEKVGTVIQVGGESAYDLGYASDSWDMPSFQDFYGSILLSND